MALDAILKLDSCLFGPEAVVAWHVLTPAAHDKRVDMIRVHCDLNSSAALYNIVPDADSHHTHVPRDVFTLRMEHHACTDESRTVEQMALVTSRTEGDAITTRTHGNRHQQRS